MDRRSIGKRGEDLVSAEIQELGWEVLARNYEIPNIGEIDIVAKDNDGFLVFLEVKTIVGALGGWMLPEDNATKSKIRKMKRAAESFVQRHENLVSNLGWRVDLAAVTIFEESAKSELTNPIKGYKINLYRNVVAEF